jgi:hypothetical protein
MYLFTVKPLGVKVSKFFSNPSWNEAALWPLIARKVNEPKDWEPNFRET